MQIDWVDDVPLQTTRGPNGVETRTFSWNGKGMVQYVFYWLRLFQVSLSMLPFPWRKHPIVLPHNVVADWPEIKEADVREYWNHLAQRKSPLANISPEKNHIPLWLWGDECEFRENGEEIMLIAFGCAIDPRKNSTECCFPLCLCRTETYIVLMYSKFCISLTHAFLDSRVES